MGVRTSYTDGTFTWVDLACTDLDKQKAFYTKLLGWSYQDIPTGEGSVYSLAMVDGKKAAALFAMPPEMKDSKAPPAWLNYIQVKDIKAAADKFKELGGQVVVPPMDVLTEGKTFGGIDSCGAFINFWEVQDHFGAEIVNDPCTLVWNELNTREPKKVRIFIKSFWAGTTKSKQSLCPISQ